MRVEAANSHDNVSHFIVLSLHSCIMYYGHTKTVRLLLQANSKSCHNCNPMPSISEQDATAHFARRLYHTLSSIWPEVNNV